MRVKLPAMANIVGVAGSLRTGSFNAALLRAAAELMPEGSSLEVASIRDIPLYNADLEASAFPDSVQALKERIAASDGLLLVSPEYNNSMPGVLKNAIDWLSRPPADMARVFGDRPVALMGATPGRGGTLLSQAAWLPVLRTLGTRAWFGPRIAIASANAEFDPTAGLQNPKLRSQVQRFMHGFVDFIEREGRAS